MERRNVYELFVKQAQNGNSYASWMLSQMHQQGRNCERSMSLFLEYLELSARQGSPIGRRDLALAVLRGMTQVMSLDDAYRELGEVMRIGLHRNVALLLLQSGRPELEQQAVEVLKQASLERGAFEARELLAIHHAIQAGVPLSLGELNSHLHEIQRQKDPARSPHANRALWLADISGRYFGLEDLVATVTALARQSNPESRVDAYELARSMRGGVPAELKSETATALAAAAAMGHTHARLIALTESLAECNGDYPQEITEQVIEIIRAQPEFLNAHVVGMLASMQEQNPECAQEHLQLLQSLQMQDCMPLRRALVQTLLNLERYDEALDVILELVGFGDVSYFSVLVNMQKERFKAGEIDAETALFWAESWQMDNHQDGLVAVSEIYEAMGSQTAEHKLAHYQVLEERAAQGDFEACCDLGTMLIEGTSIALSNKTRAFELLQKAAEAKIPRAMYQLGLCHVRGLGTGIDEDLGHFWITQAAAAGYSRSKFSQVQREARENQSMSERESETNSESSDDGERECSKEEEDRRSSEDLKVVRLEDFRRNAQEPARITEEGA